MFRETGCSYSKYRRVLKRLAGWFVVETVSNHQQALISRPPRDHFGGGVPEGEATGLA